MNIKLKSGHIRNMVVLMVLISTSFIDPYKVSDCQTGTERSATLTAGEIVKRIQEFSGIEWAEETVDRYITGSSDQVITGVVTTFMATRNVLKKAVEQNCNFIITHEPTFYNHLDDTKPLEGDPVQQEKMKFIRDHNLVIWRFHDHIHRMIPDGIDKGMIKGLGWEKYLVSGEENVFLFPETSLKEFAGTLEKHFNVTTVRVIGNPDMTFTKVGFSAGAPTSISQIEMLQRDDIEVLVAGESREWETVEYVRDAVDEGMKKAIILLGHVISEEYGMKYLAGDLKGVIPEVPVIFVSAGNPFWNP